MLKNATSTMRTLSERYLKTARERDEEEAKRKQAEMESRRIKMTDLDSKSAGGHSNAPDIMHNQEVRELKLVIAKLQRRLEQRKAQCEKYQREEEELIKARRRDVEMIQKLRTSLVEEEERQAVLVAENQKLVDKLQRVTAECDEAVSTIQAVSSDTIEQLTRCLQEQVAKNKELEERVQQLEAINT